MINVSRDPILREYNINADPPAGYNPTLKKKKDLDPNLEKMEVRILYITIIL